MPLSAADHGVPQHRRRVFLVGFADLAAWEAFVVPPAVPPAVSPRPTVRGVLRELGPPNGRDGHEVHGYYKLQTTATRCTNYKRRALGGGEAPLCAQIGANPPTHPRQFHCRGTGVLLGCQLGARWCLASSLTCDFNMIKN